MSNSVGPVVKVGGSLLRVDGFVDRLDTWLDRLPLRPAALLIGGGCWVEAIREADRRRPLDVAAAHWLCVSAMSLTARLVGQWLPRATLTSDLENVRAHHLSDGQRWILDPEPFLRHTEPSLQGTPLPVGWHVTSDSIAARLAEVIDACELILLKSTLPAHRSIQAAADQGYVDPHFPRAVRQVKAVRCVDFRRQGFPCVLIQRGGD